MKRYKKKKKGWELVNILGFSIPKNGGVFVFGRT
jgi:hypothetical protein